MCFTMAGKMPSKINQEYFKNNNTLNKQLNDKYIESIKLMY